MNKSNDNKILKKNHKYSFPKVLIITFLFIFLLVIMVSNVYALILALDDSKYNQAKDAEEYISTFANSSENNYTSKESVNQDQYIARKDKIESAFISTGINVVILIVTVWAGLNIINAITKSDIEGLSEKLTEFEEAKDNIENQANLIKEEFAKKELIRLLIMDSDYPTELFRVYFNDINLSYTILSIMVKIENQYSIADNLHDSSFQENKKIITTAKEGLDLIEQLLKYIHENNKYEDNIIRWIIYYCKYRQAAFNL